MEMGEDGTLNISWTLAFATLIAPQWYLFTLTTKIIPRIADQ